jgi:hypothetical protein
MDTIAVALFSKRGCILERWGISIKENEMSTGPDIAVYSPDHQLQLVVEVKSTPDPSSQWAAQFRRNLLENGALPNAPYLILVFPQRLFLWRSGPAAEVPPDYSARTSDVLREYLGSWAEHAPHLGEESLEIAVSSWLRELTSARRAPHPESDADRILMDSGAYEAIRHGSVTSDAYR